MPGQPSAPAGLEMPARMASAAVLIAAAVLGLLAGGWVFSLVVAVIAIAALLEWHRLVNAGHIAPEMAPSSLAMLALVWLTSPVGRTAAGAALAIGGGALATGLLAAARNRGRAWLIPWHAAGAVYLGVSSWALMVLRGIPAGIVTIGGVFIAVWLTDTAALLTGRAIGGAKLAPRLSPNKTWAGFAGGVVAAGIGEAVYVAILGGAVFDGAVLGIVLALSGHAGDLFESWVKRRFHAKNSGSLIPGHGGVLDRIDSLLFAAPVCALLILFVGFNPFAGASLR